MPELYTLPHDLQKDTHALNSLIPLKASVLTGIFKKVATFPTAKSSEIRVLPN
jgi:hypothetical protein